MAEKRNKHVWSTPKCGISFVDKYLKNHTKDFEYKYIIVRNPYNRLVSFYINKIVHQGLSGEYPPKEGMKTYKSSYENEVLIPHYGGLYTNVTFEQFLQDLKYHNPNHLERHLRPQTNNVENMTFDKIVKLENFEEDMKEVCEKLEIDYVKMINHKKPNSFPKKKFDENIFYDKLPDYFRENGTPENINGFYNDELREIVQKLYKNDFIKFGYIL